MDDDDNDDDAKHIIFFKFQLICMLTFSNYFFSHNWVKIIGGSLYCCAKLYIYNDTKSYIKAL